MKSGFLFVLLFPMVSTTSVLYAQENSASNNDIISLSREEENLNVFQDWIRWENPGSLLVHHLTTQAMNHYGWCNVVSVKAQRHSGVA